MANIEALQQLKRVVRGTPAESFNIARWKCGTIVCAWGGAASDPWFQERGLVLKSLNDAIPFYMGKSGFHSCFLFLDISSQESHFIFDPCYYSSFTGVTREMVIARIDIVIDSYTAQKDAHVQAYRARLSADALFAYLRPTTVRELEPA